MTYFRKEIYVNELKITIKFNVNFRSIVLKYILYLAMSVFWKSWTLLYLFITARMLVHHFFCKIFLSKSVCRRFSIRKTFLKNFAKLTERYMKLEVASWKETPVEVHSCTTSEVYLEPYHTFMMKLLAVVFSQKCLITDICQGSKYGSAISFFNISPISVLGYLNEYMNILFSSESGHVT